MCEQLHIKSLRNYTDVGAFDELPLGEEFQSHVRCFMHEGGRTFEDKYRMAAKVIQQLAISARIAETKVRCSRGTVYRPPSTHNLENVPLPRPIQTGGRDPIRVSTRLSHCCECAVLCGE